jgi:hypothetical protein
MQKMTIPSVFKLNANFRAKLPKLVEIAENGVYGIGPRSQMTEDMQ